MTQYAKFRTTVFGNRRAGMRRGTHQKDGTSRTSSCGEAAGASWGVNGATCCGTSFVSSLTGDESIPMSHYSVPTGSLRSVTNGTGKGNLGRGGLRGIKT
jgi:hypothetical protein